MKMVKAKFVGNGKDLPTSIMGIVEGKKYDLMIERAGFFNRVFRKFDYFVTLKSDGRWYRIPYGSRDALITNWKFYRKGGVGI